ncbi:hypothetical protein CHLNCDRAFT_58174 [Chlorella variabilis]|uniref:Uncharacterized protein n=1 Tax=Chlorella variabilis TaxID=554065 RepID=E1ZHX3_CHLVA|nr:hypothetical protein CHLNCDRAFT_58174 [Chlorella variabilis]EFN54679.1 hypothetical protein CHLNCDRAFT_58174 [Chlorella variabilis]|eukprot:XP_005846781.1 hypothetical protein CHLNCDRAFT_58174 [Chlorella variabilis]
MMPLVEAPFCDEMYATCLDRVATIKDASAPVKDRIEAIQLMHGDAGWGDNGREAMRAGAIEALVEVATDGWPQGGDLASSSCPYDEVIEVGTSTGQEEEEEEEQEYRCRHKRSMRRVAICCLTEMGNYQPLALRMAAAGLLDRGLPDMIRDSLARYRYGQSLRSMEESADQVQHIAERLLNLCASLVGAPGSTDQQVMARCGDVILEGYDAFARVAAASDLHPGQDGAHLRHDPEWADAGSQDDCGLRMPNPQPENFLRFWGNGLRWLGSPAEQDRLVAKGLVGKLRQTEASGVSCKSMVLAALEPTWERYSAREAKKAASELKEVTKAGKSARHLGNEAFQAGQYEEAVAQYEQGIAATPQDPQLFGNMSLALLRLERFKESLEAAQAATRFDPTRPKFWARMGDAHRALGQHACALLCYEQAAKLAPRDEEIQQRKDAAEAAVEPAEQLRVAELPRQQQIYQDEAWLQSLADRSPDELAEVMDEEVDKATRKLLGLAPDGTEDWRHTPRGMFLDKIGPLLDLAESAATAGSAPAGLGQWCASWSDMPPMLDQKGPMFMISVMCDHEQRMSMLRQGRPTAPLIVQALKLGMTHPEMPDSRPERPLRVLVAHRMKAEYAAVEAEMRRLGVMCQLETREEALASAAAHGTNADGFNFADKDEA